MLDIFQQEIEARAKEVLAHAGRDGDDYAADAEDVTASPDGSAYKA